VTEPIRAAGAVLWRPAAAGIEVCVVHRPRYDDWTLPKGKLHHGEHPLAAAVREIAEETGVRGDPQLRLPDVEYLLPGGVPKVVQFWSMRAVDGPAAAVADPDEVDATAWLPPAQAAARLSHAADARLAARVAELPPVTAVLPLVRHSTAGERKAWHGPDALRPLDEAGRRQAERLADVLALFGPRRLYSAGVLRCRQTLEPLADRLGLPIVTDGAFAEPADAADAPAKGKAAAARLMELRDGGRAVVCSQGKVIPPMLAVLTGLDDPASHKTPKGGGRLLTWAGERLLGASPF
jgi:8-oxo-(d)GTP phosphatase